jgi:hypothetical protein
LTEVQDFDAGLVRGHSGDHDVARLEVAVGDAFGVGFYQCFGDLDAIEQNQLQRKSVIVKGDRKSAPEKPVPIFQASPQTAATIFSYDVSPDGQRFLVLVPGQGPNTPPPPITVLLNWTSVLSQRREP